MDRAVLGRSTSAGHPESLPSPSRASLVRRSSDNNPSTVHPQGTPNKAQRSKFKRALKHVEVPAALQQGIPVMRVFANGQKPTQQYLTLSRDKFTLHITSAPIHGRLLQEKKHSRSGSWLPSILKRNASVDSISTVSGKPVTLQAAEGSRKRANKEIRAIDIGAIHRIQRGAHNANLKNTTTSAETVQNLTRRTRTDRRNKDSYRLVSPGSTPDSTHRRHMSANGAPDFPSGMSTASSYQIYDPSDITNPDPIANANFDFKNPNFQSGKNKAGSLRRGRSSVSSMRSDQEGTTADLDPGMCFSIIFRGDWTLDLMMTDFDIMTTKAITGSCDSSNGNTSRNNNEDNSVITRDEVIDALDNLIRAYSIAKQQVSNEVLLMRYVWSDSDVEKSNMIKPDELGVVLDRINYQMKRSELSSRYNQYCKVIGLKNKDRKYGLTFEQTLKFLHKIKRDSWVRKPVHQYWNDLFGEFMNNNKPRMNVSKKTFLEKFLHEKQGERNATMKDVDLLFKRLNEVELPHVTGEGTTKDAERIDKDRFEVYLLGEDNDAFDPRREAFVEKSMHRPISEYWINSSHNTYLTGDQLTSNSSIDMYSSALYRGCKCLELDVWDGGYSNGEPVPVVYHGHTMTSKILYKDIIKAIKLYVNFHPDTFPLILSYENHCTLEFQEVMAEQLVEILGEALYIPREESLQRRLPSPTDLRGMVVIKGRRPTELDDFDDRNSEFGAPSTVLMSDISELNSSIVTSQTQKSTLQKVCPSLARLTLFHGTKLKDWDTSLTNPTHYMHSFTETKISKLSRRPDRQKWVIYNQSHMTRSYPSGSRVDSSNYSPILPWAVGTQLVALNFQTVDPPLLLNDGRFRENGGCGYVLKSTKLIDLQEPPNRHNRESRVPIKLSIRVLSGSCLPKPNGAHTGDCINPYVRVSVYDVKNGNKESTVTFSTEYVANNGFFPIWNGEKFSFQIENYETAMIQLSVFDAAHTTGLGDELIASSSIPVCCLRQGLRSVKLFDTSNTRSGAFDFASLLVDIKKQKQRLEDISEAKPRSSRSQGSSRSQDATDAESTMIEI